MDWRCDGSAAALQNFYGKLIPRRLERETKTGRRWLGRRSARAKQDDKSAACLGGDGEPAQLLVPGIAEPDEQRMTGPGTQHLLRRPQSIAPAWRAHHREIREIDAGGSQGGGIRQMRRRKPYDALSRRR